MGQIMGMILKYIGDGLKGILAIFMGIVTTILSSIMIYLAKAFMVMFEIKQDAFFAPKGTEKLDIIQSMIQDFTPKFQAVAFAVLILVATWHVFKGFFSFLGLGTEPEEAWKIGLKCILFGILLLYSKDICKFGLYIFDQFKDLTGFDPVDFNVDVIGTFTSGVDGLFDDPQNFDEGLGNIADAGGMILIDILKLVFLIIFTFILIGVGIDMSGKYLKIAILIIIAPVSFACGVTKATNQIFTSWVKSAIGTLMSVFIKYFLMGAFFSKVLTIGMSGSTSKESMSNLIIMLCYVSLIKQSDNLVNELGFAAGMTPAGASGMIGQVITTAANLGIQKKLSDNARKGGPGVTAKK